MKQFYPCGLIVSVSIVDCGLTWFTTKNGVVSLDCNMAGGIVCFKQSHRDSQHWFKNTTARSQDTVVRRFVLEKLLTQDFKGPHKNGKDLLTNRKDPWPALKEVKGLLLKNQCPRTSKDPKGTWEPCIERMRDGHESSGLPLHLAIS